MGCAHPGSQRCPIIEAPGLGRDCLRRPDDIWQQHDIGINISQQGAGAGLAGQVEDRADQGEVPCSLRATSRSCCRPYSAAASANPSASSPTSSTSTSGPRHVQDCMALRWMVAIWGSVKGFGAVKMVEGGHWVNRDW